MATLNAVVTSMADLWSTIGSFLTANGFTQVSGSVGTHIGWNDGGNLHFQVSFPTNSAFTIYQSTGYTSGQGLGAGAGDSGFPSVVSLLGVNITSCEVWGFSPGDAEYARFVIEFNRDGRFAHFGVGNDIDHLNDWSGGAHKYGWEWQTAAAQTSQPGADSHRILLDSNTPESGPGNNLGTMRVAGLPTQDPASIWGAFTGASSAGGNDTAGNPVHVLRGHSRSGGNVQADLEIPISPNSARIGLIPVEVLAASGASSDRPLGYMPDIAVCNIAGIQPKDIIEISPGEDWQFFPWAQKLSLPDVTGETIPASRNFGVAYRIRT